jgi:hypothetical protein
MSNAYQFIFECRKCRQNISVARKSSKPSLSEVESKKMFAGEEIRCDKADCGWHGKASRIRLLRVVPFQWIYSPATLDRKAS